MSSKLLRLFFPLGLMTATIAGTAASVDAQPPRHQKYAAAPDREPPPRRAERDARPRKGYIWVAGDWDWKFGKWTWVAGHYERDRPGKQYTPPRWEQRDGRWQRGAGGWGDHH
jgi:hypothetical protein